MYFQLSKCVFSQQFQYKESILFRFIGIFLWVYVQLSVWYALLQYRSDERSFEVMVVYVLAVQLITLFMQSDVAVNLAEKVRTGQISIDLIRPINIKWYSFWEQISANLFEILFLGIPVLIIGGVIWDTVKLELMNILCFFIGTILAVLLNFYFQYVVGLLSFWFKDGTYARMFISGLMTIFSGKQIPLWFYPSALYAVCSVLPFRFMVQEPVSILLGEYGKTDILSVFGLQIIWILIFWGMERMIWRLIQRQIEIQGG